jgi:histidinol-phosphate/aromatic aminotransferase/cobyric acid decarboxylase-like protein
VDPQHLSVLSGVGAVLDLPHAAEVVNAALEILTTHYPCCCNPLSHALQGVQVDPQHLSVLSGVGAVLDLMFQCISEPGDGVLIPAPYYPAFDNDLRVSVDNWRTR